jgi:glycosyltransferase involved in cell wall biosynthesis
VVISEEAVQAHETLGVDPSRLDFLPPALHPEDFEAHIPTPACSAPTVVYAGNPDRYQELDLLLRAMCRVVRRLPDARLRVVSSAPLDEITQLARAEGLHPRHLDLHTTSRWGEVQALMRQCTVAALPRGLCRGFPIKLLNYMALGLPVVACAGSAKVGRDGETGRIVQDGDATAFAAALEELLIDPAKARRMGERARASILQEHCWERRVVDLESVYRRTAGLDPVARAEPLR